MRCFPRAWLLAACLAVLGTVVVFVFQPAGGSSPEPSWEREGEAVFISDLSQSRPAEALSEGGRPGTWKVVPFSTSRTSGKMLYSAPGRNRPVPELRLSVPLEGWHAVYAGIQYQYIWHRPQLLKLRFASDPAFTWFTNEGRLALRIDAGAEEAARKIFTDRDVVEVFWKVENLKREDLIIARKSYQPLRVWHAGTDFAENLANLAYLKLIPLSEREVQRAGAWSATPKTKRLLAINDMGWLRWVRSREELREELEPLRDSDAFAMLWGTFRGFYCAYFRTKAGAIPTGGDVEFNKFFTTFGEGMDAFKKLGIDPLEEAVSYAHSFGLKLIASIRMDGPKPPPYDGNPGPFYDQHPEYRLVAPDGSPTLRLSLAYPEVRQRYLELFREALSYGVDGIAIVFTRNFPFVGFEKPVVQSFRGAPEGLTGEQLLKDERFLRHQADFVTLFLREIRRLLDEEGARRSQRLMLVTVIGGNPPAHPYEQEKFDAVRGALEFGWDVKRWTDEALIDFLVLHPWHALEVTQEEVRAFSEVTRGSSVRFQVDFFPEQLSAEEIRLRTLEYYASGADGFMLWNTDSRVKKPGEWAMWRLLGHTDLLEENPGLGRLFFRVVPLESLAGVKVDPSWWHSTG